MITMNILVQVTMVQVIIIPVLGTVLEGIKTTPIVWIMITTQMIMEVQLPLLQLLPPLQLRSFFHAN